MLFFIMIPGDLAGVLLVLIEEPIMGMKIAVFAAAVAVIATQIGCTWWLSHQAMRLKDSDWQVVQTTLANSVRTECYAKDLRRMLIAMDRHESISEWIESRTNCLWDADARPDLSK